MKRFIHLSMKKKLVAAGLAVGVTLGVGGAAFAYFTTGGSGTGTAGVGTSSDLTINQVGSISGLLPGGGSQPIEYSIDNTSTGNQDVTGVTVAIASITAPAAVGGLTCTSPDFTLTQPNTVPGDIAAKTTYTSAPSGASISMNDTASNQDGCKGATVNLSFTATA
ncbi:MAG: hypothetical protein JWO62_3077 [Acidimicrobiaceae bacterium]|nr:hypothetical protein [Acidimicrobiaceae bacterium]